MALLQAEIPLWKITKMVAGKTVPAAASVVAAASLRATHAVRR